MARSRFQTNVLQRRRPVLRRPLLLVGVGLAVILSAAVAPASSLASDVTPFSPSTPTVSSPIPWTKSSTPFLASGVYPEWPMPAGYEEKEYLLSGKASVYEFTPTGIQVVSPCPASVTGSKQPSCSELPYTTRMLILMPKDPKRFSGNVWVDPLNPSAGYDYRDELDRTEHYHVAKGDIYVMWTSKGTAVHSLKKWDPKRYKSLFWPFNPKAIKDNPLSSTPYDGITYDIAGQVGAMLKANGSASPINGYDVKRVFEAGFSQDGGFTFTFANIFSHLERMPGGGPIYDGYLPQGINGTSDINFGLTPDGAVSPSDPRYKMQPRDVPVIKVNTETEIDGFTRQPVQPVNWRRPDSNKPNDRYREWEVPGASHDDVQSLLDPSNEALFGVSSFPSECAHAGKPNVSPTDFRYEYVADAASQALLEWVTKGKAPAHASPIAQTNLKHPSPASVKRDRYGNALGGVRTPQVEVPISTYHVIDQGPDFCWSIGWSTPLSKSTLRKLYPTHADYVRKFRKSATETVEAGFWLPEDAKRAIQEAKQARVP